MDAISLWQPYASLIACGAKPFETRDWAPPARLIGQRIAVCAGKKIDKDDGALLAQDLMLGDLGLALRMRTSFAECPQEMLGDFGPDISFPVLLPIGCVVCTAVLDAAFQLGEPAKGTFFPSAQVAKRLISRNMPECFTVRYDDYGDYGPGRWAWLLRDVEVCKPPIAVKGRQKFFTLPDHVITALAMRDT